VKKIFSILVIILLASYVFGQETFSQFEARLKLLSDRSLDLFKIIKADGYKERVGFDTYVDSMAKLTAYSWFLSQGWDSIYRQYWDLQTREWGESVIGMADWMNSMYENLRKWGTGLTGNRGSDLKPWTSVYFDLVDGYVRLLINGATRL